jgi:hypothetical protein
MRRFKLTAILLSCCMLVFAALGHGLPASGQTDPLDPQVSSMEKRFFGRTYRKDTMDQRVTRLEKEVFGTTKTGPVEGRIIALGTAVMDPNLSTPSKHAKPLQSEAPQQAPQQLSPEQPQQQSSSQPQPQSSYQQQSAPEQQQSAPAKKAENDVHLDYPAIDRLEKQLLGRTYPNDPLKSRLARMELKAFGAVSSTDDLSGRREALEQYAKFYNGGTPQMGGSERPQISTPTQPQGNPGYARNPEEERSYSPNVHQRSAYDMYGPQAGSTRREQAPARREAPRRAPTAAEHPVRKPAGNPDEMSPAQLEQWLKKQNQ